MGIYFLDPPRGLSNREYNRDPTPIMENALEKKIEY